jgi:hypothetical protein
MPAWPSMPIEANKINESKKHFKLIFIIFFLKGLGYMVFKIRNDTFIIAVTKFQAE